MPITPEDNKKLSELLGLLKWFDDSTTQGKEIYEKSERAVSGKLWILSGDEKDSLLNVITAIEDCI